MTTALQRLKIDVIRRNLPRDTAHVPAATIFLIVDRELPVERRLVAGTKSKDTGLYRATVMDLKWRLSAEGRQIIRKTRIRTGECQMQTITALTEIRKLH